MREVTQAHYLHERHGLEAVLRPPVSQPTTLCWIPGREELIVATRSGELISVDPVLGTRQIANDVGEVAHLSVHPDRKRYLLLAREGHWRIGSLRGEVLSEGRHGFLGGMSGLFAKNYAVLVGDSVDERTMLIVGDGEIKVRKRLPARSAPGLGPDNRLIVAQSTPSGLSVRPLARRTRFDSFDSTAHRLQACNDMFLGLTPSGVAVWKADGGQPSSLRFPDLTAGDISRDGLRVGLGTRSGAVALASLDNIEKRIRPNLIKAFEQPITSVRFSTRGRWLATAAEAIQIWSWED